MSVCRPRRAPGGLPRCGGRVAREPGPGAALGPRGDPWGGGRAMSSGEGPQLPVLLEASLSTASSRSSGALGSGTALLLPALLPFPPPAAAVSAPQSCGVPAARGKSARGQPGALLLPMGRSRSLPSPRAGSPSGSAVDAGGELQAGWCLDMAVRHSCRGGAVTLQQCLAAPLRDRDSPGSWWKAPSELSWRVVQAGGLGCLRSECPKAGAEVMQVAGACPAGGQPRDFYPMA